MAKNAVELSEIMSKQLDSLMSKNADRETIKLADAVSNVIGKELKLAALRMNYYRHIKEGGPEIESLSGE